MKLDLYKVDSNYFNYLRNFEPKVPLTKERRPFLGVLIKVNYKNYFAPLASPKEKYKNIHLHKDLIKIDDGKLGVINLNNMIPIPESRCIKINIDKIKDKKYKMLLKKQLIWCNESSYIINEMAEELYKLVCYKDKENTILKDRCCDFKLLERKCIEYMKVNTLNEKEFLYSVC